MPPSDELRPARPPDGRAYQRTDEPATPAGHRSGSGIATRTASPRSALLCGPGALARRATPSRSGVSSPPCRGVRRRLLLASVPTARNRSEEQRRVVGRQTRRQRQARPRHGFSPGRCGVDGDPGVGARGSDDGRHAGGGGAHAPGHTPTGITCRFSSGRLRYGLSNSDARAGTTALHWNHGRAETTDPARHPATVQRFDDRQVGPRSRHRLRCARRDDVVAPALNSCADTVRVRPW